MSQTNCTQYTTGTCAPTLNANASDATLFDVAPLTGPWSSIDSTCPVGQTMFVGRALAAPAAPAAPSGLSGQSTTNQQGPFYYTCATNLDNAKAIFGAQQPNQWPLQRSRSLCNSGGNIYTSCSYFNDDPSAGVVSAQVLSASHK